MPIPSNCLTGPLLLIIFNFFRHVWTLFHLGIFCFYLFIFSFLIPWLCIHAQPVYQSACLLGWEQDGTCNSFIKSTCVDPREVCINGICCQPSKNAIPQNPAMPCPIGTTPNGACPRLGFCWTPSETCISSVCCRTNPDMINMIVGQQGMGGFGGMGQQGMGIPGGMGGFGGMNGIGGMGGFGGINGIGGIGGGGMNGIGGIGGGIGFPFGCTDFDPSCRYFVSYCFLESISEACMTSCGICSMSSGNMFGANGLGGAMGNYGRFGNAVMGKRK